MAFFRELSTKMPHVARRLIFVTGDVAGTEAERFLEDRVPMDPEAVPASRICVRVARETLGVDNRDAGVDGLGTRRPS